MTPEDAKRIGNGAPSARQAAIQELAEVTRRDRSLIEVHRLIHRDRVQVYMLASFALVTAWGLALSPILYPLGLAASVIGAGVLALLTGFGALAVQRAVLRARHALSERGVNLPAAARLIALASSPGAMFARLDAFHLLDPGSEQLLTGRSSIPRWGISWLTIGIVLGALTLVLATFPAPIPDSPPGTEWMLYLSFEAVMLPLWGAFSATVIFWNPIGRYPDTYARSVGSDTILTGISGARYAIARERITSVPEESNLLEDE